MVVHSLRRSDEGLVDCMGADAADPRDMTQIILVLHFVGFFRHPVCGVHDHGNYDQRDCLCHEKDIGCQHPIRPLHKNGNEKANHYRQDVVRH